MEKFIIQGGKKLHGSVRLGGAKNASFKLMIASLLAKGESRLLNIPHIDDVEITRRVITHLGGEVHSAGERMLCIDASFLKTYKIPLGFGKKSRASSLFIAPLLARFNKAIVPLPGGDRIGARPLERHFSGFKALGAKIETVNSGVLVSADRLIGTRYKFEKNTHTGTETLIMAAVLAQGKTILENAALEPEVDDLITFLVSMGAKIQRKPGRKIEIVGVKGLKPTIHSIMPDRNEAISYACAALATRGDVVVENARKDHLEAFLNKLKEAGGGYDGGKFGIRFFFKKPLKSVDVVTRPYPGFMTDWQPLWAVLMTQARGTATIHEAVHNNRFQYVEYLRKMGAGISLFNPKVKNPQKFYNFNIEDDLPEYYHAEKIQGPRQLKGTKLEVHDLRAGATLVLAALIAQGTSTISGIEHIDRGYENLDGRLIDLGADIKRV
jgi:UDP-N-acetylglucosamine 1-carboxyvinyltransferase